MTPFHVNNMKYYCKTENKQPFMIMTNGRTNEILTVSILIPLETANYIYE